MKEAPTLTAFAAPRGGGGRPWDGPAGAAWAPALTSFAQDRFCTVGPFGRRVSR